ncbi:YciI family protein [Streptomyces sp. NPDC058375]|uniref:YciI family protein n=1 Tax=Streptomyces sp. NPDC058375 TaxID=3346467 RepID=UPI0036659B69
MAKYLLLKHDRGAPVAVNDVPMDRWTPEEISAHMQYVQDFADRLEKTKDLIAGWMIIDVDSHDRAVELAGELSAAPGAGGKPIHEWLEVRPFLTAPPTVTE